MDERSATEWHRNDYSPCEVCGCWALVGTPHRALTVVESEASKCAMCDEESAGYVVGFKMTDFPRPRGVR